MRFEKQLIEGILIRRYKRFLADITLQNGETVTAHCANTGSMMQMAVPGSRVMISKAANPERKTAYDWQLIMVNGQWAGINTAVPNKLLREGFERGLVPEFAAYDSISMEVKYGKGSRADAVLTGEAGLFYIEAKNVTLVENGRALFPDAITSRGLKHLEELAGMVREGHRAAMFFLTQRMDADSIGIASQIDSNYARKILQVVREGVEVLSWRANVTPDEITLDCPVPFIP